MRAALLFCVSVVLGSTASIVACAGADDEAELEPSPDSGEGVSVVPDSGPNVPAEEPDVEADAGKCNEAGWCRTTLPDRDLMMKDIWPVGGRAFAIADSPTLGVKVLAWNEVDDAWEYIDDGTQNYGGLGNYAGRIWAPSEDEVYYGVGPGYIYHGKAPVLPATTWSWTSQRLRDAVEPLAGYPLYGKLSFPGSTSAYRRYPALGVWGTSRDDVYAWFLNTIYHRTSVDGGAPEWVPEYVADDPGVATERLDFLAATGTSPDRIWFSGARSRSVSACALLVRKTLAGYQRIADGILTGNSANTRCAERPGALLIGGAEGWLVDVQATSDDRIIGLKGARDTVSISVDGGGYSVAVVPVPTEVTRLPLFSLWGAPGNLWLSGPGLVLRSKEDVWDGGAYEVSPLTLGNVPIRGPIFRVRGTSNTNLWAIGVSYALHKTTP